MRLPGGLWRDGERLTEFAFQPATGAVELAVAQSTSQRDPPPRRVTAVLAEVLEHIGGRPVEPADVRALAVGDRQFLMRRLGALLGFDEIWLTASCSDCESPFDFLIAPAALPVKVAAEGFPFVEVDTSRGRRRFRVPIGEDQEAVADMADESAAARRLVGLCAVPAEDQKDVPGDDFTDDDIAGIDAALEAVAPEVATTALAACPECGHGSEVYIDPAVWIDLGGGTILGEIHALASTYHWSEAEILGLPRDRRQRYLRMIERDTGMFT